MSATLWKLGIGIATALIVFWFGQMPVLPRPILPLITPFVGIVLGVGIKYLAQLNLSWLDMAQAGALGVFFRECTNQILTKEFLPREASKTAAKPIDGAVAVLGYQIQIGPGTTIIPESKPFTR